MQKIMTMKEHMELVANLKKPKPKIKRKKEKKDE